MRILMWTVIAIVAAAAFVAVGTAYAAGYGVPPAAAPGARGTPGAPAQYYGYSGPGMMGYYGGYAAGYGYYGGYIQIGSAMAAEATPRGTDTTEATSRSGARWRPRRRRSRGRPPCRPTIRSSWSRPAEPWTWPRTL